MKALLVYHSHTGNTKEAARYLFQQLQRRGIDCDMLEVTPQERGAGFLSNVYKTVTNKKADINECAFDPAEYDYIFVGTPVWAHQPTPAIKTFLKEMPPVEGQSVFPYVTLAKTGGSATISSIKKQVEEKGAQVPGGLSLKTRGGVSEELRSQIEAFVGRHCGGEPAAVFSAKDAVQASSVA